MKRSLKITLLLFLLSACAVGPDFKRPAPPQTNRYTKEDLPAKIPDQHFVTDQDIPADWWTLFHSPPLNSMMADALKNSPDLKSAEAALRQAQENVSAQEGSFFPIVQASFEPTRQKNAGVIAPTLASNQRLFNLYTAQLSANWTPDLFGGNRRQVEALQAQAEYQRFQLAAADLTLTGNIAATAIQEASLRAQITTTQDLIRIDKEQLEIMQRQLALGAIPEANVIAQQTVLAQAQATLPSLQKQLAQGRDMLSTLSGRLPSDEPAETFDFTTMQLPKDIPLTLPSKLVEQRPDIRAAEAQLHAASAQIGVAVSNILPNVTLSATDGSTGTAFAQLFSASTGFWSISGNAMQTLFDAGTLWHKKRAAEAAFDQAKAEYQKTVIAAFGNVADCLRAIQYDGEAAQDSLIAEKSAANSLEIARKQVALGASSYLVLLNAEQLYAQASLALIQANANRYIDTAVLIQALGGGWWNRK